MKRIIFAVLMIAVIGCQSKEYEQAYEYAKDEGRSELFAKAYAKKVDEGKGKIYAKDYADAIEMAEANPKYSRDEKSIVAEIYADKKFEGYTAVYAARYANMYCQALPLAKEKGKDREFAHQYVKHFLEGESWIKKSEPYRNTEYVKFFALYYGTARAMGMPERQAFTTARKAAENPQF